MILPLICLFICSRIYFSGFPVLEIVPLTAENGVEHHTSKFKTNEKTMVLRRGQTFDILLRLARDYQTDDNFYFTLRTGERPRDKDKTLITVTEILPKDFSRFKANGDKWGFQMLAGDDPKDIVVQVYIPPDALPAKYELLIETDEGTAYEQEEPIYVLFNPWCKGIIIKNKFSCEHSIVAFYCS